MEPKHPMATLCRLLRDSDPYELEEPSDEERAESRLQHQLLAPCPPPPRLRAPQQSKQQHNLKSYRSLQHQFKLSLSQHHSQYNHSNQHLCRLSLLAVRSEDEVDVLLHGTPDQKRKLIRECLTGESESSSDDEFEKEMAAELNSTMKALEGSWKTSGTEASSDAGPAAGAMLAEGGQSQFYDEVYFDSDSEDEERAQVTTKKRRKQKHRILSNDELLYDPQQDDKDQAWVDARRRGYSNLRRALPGHPASQPLPNSDAILNCPACMTTLCLDCQRHESYKTQYRAMFVMNCSVAKEEVLKYQDALDQRKRRRPKKRKYHEVPEQQLPEVYHPVKCTECSTEVAVYDKEEVYHFFNVLASHC